jgi:hypothetical protein
MADFPTIDGFAEQDMGVLRKLTNQNGDRTNQNKGMTGYSMIY